MECCNEGWKRRCAALHGLEVQKKVLKDEVLAIIEEASKEEVGGLRRHVEVHNMNVNVASMEEMLS